MIRIITDQSGLFHTEHLLQLRKTTAERLRGKGEWILCLSLTERFFGRSTNQIHLLLMQELCRYPRVSIGAFNHELFSAFFNYESIEVSILKNNY